MDTVTLAPFRAPVLAEVVPASAGPARVELKVEIVASQPPPAMAEPARQLPRRQLPPSDALELPVQRLRVAAAYAGADAIQPRAGLIVDVLV